MSDGQLNTSSFLLEIARIPIMKFSCQEVTFPDVTLPHVEQANPLRVINHPGDHLDHSDLSFSFVVDDKLDNYNVIYHWMEALAFPEKFDQFKDFVHGLKTDNNMETFSRSTRMNQFSDVSITLLSSLKNPLFTYRFKDAFPVSLSGPTMSITSSDTEPVITSCSMKFTGFSIEPVNKYIESIS
jgi:hypothetical protein